MLLTKTTELAMLSLLYLARQPGGYLVNPEEIAAELKESPTYTAKVLRKLARSGLLRSRRGAAGGFVLARPPRGVTLLEVVEACQGTVPGNYCPAVGKKKPGETCGYHQAMVELQASTRRCLGAWTLARVLGRPTSPRLIGACHLRRVLQPAVPPEKKK